MRLVGLDCRKNLSYRKRTINIHTNVSKNNFFKIPMLSSIKPCDYLLFPFLIPSTATNARAKNLPTFFNLCPACRENLGGWANQPRVRQVGFIQKNTAACAAVFISNIFIRQSRGNKPLCSMLNICESLTVTKEQRLQNFLYIWLLLVANYFA